MNLAEHLDRAARLHGRRPALVGDTGALDYRSLAARSVRAAALLEHAGVAAGDRVVLLLPHGVDFASWYYAVLRLGAVAVALDPASPETAQLRQIAEVDAGLVVAAAPGPTLREGVTTPLLEAAALDVDPTGAGLAPIASPAPPVPRSADDLAVIVYTSGTTAAPQAAALTHGNLLHDALHVAEEVLELTEQDVVLGLLPFHGAFGQTCVLNAAVVSGASVALAPRDDLARAVEILDRSAATVVVGVPSMFLGLLSTLRGTPARTAADHVRVCLCGGAALPLGLLLDLERILGCVVLEGYGLSEAAPVVTANRIDRRRLGSVGLPLPGVEVRVQVTSGEDSDAVGEVLVRGPIVMAGYWGRDGVITDAVSDGWLHTGDLGHRDADGYLHVLDRAGEVMWRDGRAVYPREIEELLYDHPAVREAAVVELPRPEQEPELVAFVTLDPPAPEKYDDLLRDLTRRLGRLPSHARPARVEIAADLPKTRTGKILKRALRTAVQA